MFEALTKIAVEFAFYPVANIVSITLTPRLLQNNDGHGTFYIARSGIFSSRKAE